MKRYFLFFAAALLLVQCKNTSTHNEAPASKVTFKKIPVKYIPTRKDTSVVDDYFGTKVPDPYRWLEDDHAEETKKWVEEENKITEAYLSKIPFRNPVKARLTKLWNYAKFSTPFKVAGKYYFFKNDGLQNQSVLFVQENLDATPVEVLNPNTFSKDGTVALGDLKFSKDGKYLAYQISEGGSDWQTILIKNLETGKTLDDRIEWVKFSGISWAGDGFFYSRYPTPSKNDKLKGENLFHQVYYHKINTGQDADQLIYADRSNPKYNFYCQTTEDERYLAISVAKSTSGNALYIKDLKNPRSNFVPVTERFESDYSLVDNIQNELLLLTNDKAPNQRLISVNADSPQEKNWKVVIPESTDVLRSVSLIGNKLFAHYLHNASSKVVVDNLDGTKAYDLALPGIGTVGSLSGKKEDNEAFFSFSSFTRPNTIYQLDAPTGKSKIFKKSGIDFDSDAYVTKQIFFKSKDGTQVPIFITHKKGLKMDGKRPTLLYGYGGFNISILPRFSLVRSLIMENDGIYAVANIRGGGEFGQNWHLAGTKEKKQNVFDDFIGAAEYLIDNGYTSSDYLGIEGGSNGGLLVGACITQRPELYGVAFPRVGVLDMLRYQNFTIGRAWAYDYGLSENENDFKYLYAYSPLHNIKDAEYPATMVMTGDHDDRVVPAHSFKFAATLQAHQKGDKPILIRIATSAGHGAGKPTGKLIQESADMLSFFFYNTNTLVKY
ncbi:MAG TPA: S9 family peptidase [Saprospiraceae bacterium]|nr:S9 family peptidase [Saprospiraceae bacterium]